MPTGVTATILGLDNNCSATISADYPVNEGDLLTVRIRRVNGDAAFEEGVTATITFTV